MMIDDEELHPVDETRGSGRRDAEVLLRDRPLLWLIAMAALAAVYFASAKLGLSLALVADQVSAVWPPTGIALAALLVLGYQVWPGIAVGAFLANATANEPLWTAGGIAAGNTLEAVVGAWLLRKAAGFDNAMERLWDVLALVLLGAVASTTVSATIGVTSLCAGPVDLPDGQRTIGWADFPSLWRVWWLGDAIGTLVVAPVILTWATAARRGLPSRPAEATLLAVTLLGVSIVVFAGGLTTGLGASSLGYVVFPFIIWAALRFGQPGTTGVTLTTASFAIWATLNGSGPFGAGPLHDRLLHLQVFMGVVAITALLLGAALCERRRAEADVRRSEERLRLAVEELQTLVNMLPVGIFMAQDVACESITMNPAGAEMLRIPRDANASKTGAEAGSLSFRLLKDAREVPAEDLPMQRAARTGVPVAGEELDVVRDDGSTVTLYEYASPLFDERGEVRGCLGVFVDITDRKRMEDALKESDRRKDEFLATLAHELRNPLAPIRNGVELLRLKDLRDPLLVEVRDMLDRQVQQVTRLVDDLLDVSRVTRGKIRLQLEAVDLAAVVARAVETSRPQMEARRQELCVSVPDEPLLLQGDAMRLAQVFANLLNNAAKFTGTGGRITVTVESRNGAAVVRVRDTGAGIAPDVLPRVFDLFAQADRSLDRSEGGLGIGLTLVRSLVEMHSGTVEAFSEGLGKGSEFVVRLPLSPAPEADVAPGRTTGWKPIPHLPLSPTPEGDVSCPSADRGENSAGPAAAHRILVVDDNKDAVRSLGLLLEQAGNDVCTAYNGPSALKAAEQYRPDVVLLDIGLPGMDGYEVAQRIRAMPDLKDVLLVAMTGYGRDEDKRRSSEAGFSAHLVKPVDLNRLQSLLAQAPAG